MVNKNSFPEKGPFYAVIFSSTKSDDREGYAEMDEKTMALATQMPGFLGYEGVNNGQNSIFISYWKDKHSIDTWRVNATHKLAKASASRWYKRYLSQVCLVESSNLFEAPL